MLLIGCLLAAGCTGNQAARLRSTPTNPVEKALQFDNWSGPRPSERTQQVLRTYALTEAARRDCATVLAELKQFHRQSPNDEVCYALAELSYLAAAKQERTSRQRAVDYYWNCVAYSYEYLFAPRFAPLRNPYDPHFRKACDLYNTALEKCLRIGQTSGGFEPGKTLKVSTSEGELALEVVPRGFSWQPEDFDRFEFVSDYEVGGLTNQYRTYGLGVPLIAIRHDRSRTPEEERYYPKQLSFPTTAFLRMHLTEDGAQTDRAVLELCDPLESTDVEIGALRVPLESDFSTPLAHFLSDKSLDSVATNGLLRVDQVEKLAGLYMLQPYQPGKIPVLMIHGLWSSPMTWMEMFNDLRSNPEIRQNYQFWFYLYPTGQPFVATAANLRHELQHVRRVFDPQNQEPAFDQQVLVGHSMGGLVARMMTIDSGDGFWQQISERPFAELNAEPEVRKQVEQLLFFRANPSIRRVVTIAAPHRGSDFSNQFTQYVGRKLITFPQRMMAYRSQLLRDNPGFFRDPKLLENNMTSIDSLAPGSPFLKLIEDAPKPPWVIYHNVVAVNVDPQSIKDEAALAKTDDGVVPYASAHLDEAVSEVLVRSPHSEAQRHPLTIIEVRRILFEHLQSLRQPQPPPQPSPVVPQFEPLPAPYYQPTQPTPQPVPMLPPLAESFTPYSPYGVQRR